MKLTQNATEVLKKRYLHNDETPAQLFERVANAVSKNDKEYKDKFHEMLTSLEFIPNTPCLANAGYPNGQLSACFVLPIEDSMKGIMQTLSNAAMIFKTGGGVGYSFSNLRPRNAPVSSGKGVSSGPVSFMKLYHTLVDVVQQGGLRRGAQLACLRSDHPDLSEFISCKMDLSQYTNFNISVGALDEFMNAVISKNGYTIRNTHAGTETTSSALEIWNKLVKAAWTTGDPGLIFLDRVNDADPIGNIETSNPCWAKGSLVAHEKGLVPIEQIKVGDRVYVGNGKFENVVKVYDNGIQDVLNIIGTGGYTNTITPDHKVCTERGLIQAKDLVVGDQLEIQKDGHIPTGGDYNEGLLAGVICGDGSFSSDQLQMTFSLQDKEFVDLFIIPSLQTLFKTSAKTFIRTQRSGNDIYRWATGKKDALEFSRKYSTKDRLSEHILTGKKKFITGFIEGLFFADGHIEATNGMAIALTSVYREFLKDLQILLLQFGIKSSIYEVPRKGHVTDKKYSINSTEQAYRLQISGESRDKFCENFELHAKHSKKMLKPKKKGYKDKKVSIISIAPLNEETTPVKRRVYDFTTDGEKFVWVNGIRSFDCGEQMLPPYDSCNLGSIDTSKLVVGGKFNFERFEELIKLGVRFLDNVIDENYYPLPEIEKVTKANRRIGLGIMGWADTLIKMGIRYDSEDALKFTRTVLEDFKKTSTEYSQELAKERGPFPSQPNSKLKDDVPIRNCMRTTIAPTGSISIIAGCSSGIEPIFAVAFERDHTLMDGKRLQEVNPNFVQYMKRRKIFSDELIDKIFEHSGSIQHIDEIDDDTKAIFRTAHDIAPSWHVRMQAEFQKYIDNSISKSVNLPSTATEDDISKIYLLAYELGCKGITVFRDGCRGAQVLTTKRAIPEGRPKELQGFTRAVTTSFGKLYVTVNEFEKKPFEVFATIGKSGHDITADTEAVCRLISIGLRSGISVIDLISQLKGIGGSQPTFGEKRLITSVPDAIAYVLENKYVKGKLALQEFNFPSGKGKVCKECD